MQSPPREGSATGPSLFAKLVAGTMTAAGAWLRSFPPAQNGRALYRPLTNTSHALEWPWFGDRSACLFSSGSMAF